MIQKFRKVYNLESVILIRYLAERMEIKCTVEQGKKSYMITFDVPANKLHRFERLRTEIKKELKSFYAKNKTNATK